jgi:hypothetical protein
MLLSGYSNRSEASTVFGPLLFTPAEWRFILEDPGFLEEEDNSYHVPRRLMGVPVRIIPDHEIPLALARGAA